MKQGIVLTTQEVDDLVAAYRGGLTIDQVARQLNHNVSTVIKYLRQRGVERRPKGPQKRRQLVSQLEIRSRYEAGEPAHLIAHDYKTSKPTILKVLRAQGVAIRDISECQQKHRCDHRFFQVIDTEQKAYWLGCFTADGCIRPPNIIALGLTISDGDHVRQFANHIGTTCPVEDRVDRKWPMTEIAFRSTPITADLATYGVVPNKEQIVLWPSLPCHLIRHYLRGNCQLFPFFNWLYEGATIFLPRKRQLVLDHYRALPKYRDQLRFGTP